MKVFCDTVGGMVEPIYLDLPRGALSEHLDRYPDAGARAELENAAARLEILRDCLTEFSEQLSGASPRKWVMEQAWARYEALNL